MATIDRYKMTEDGDSYVAENSTDIHRSERNGEPFGYINFSIANKSELLAYLQGIVDKMVMDRNFQKSDSNNNNNNIIDMRGAFGDGQGMNQGKQNTNGKVLTLSNGHSILGSDNQFPGNMAAFSDRLLITLLAGVGIGVIMMSIYIFINLGKVTFSF